MRAPLALFVVAVAVGATIAPPSRARELRAAPVSGSVSTAGSYRLSVEGTPDSVLSALALTTESLGRTWSGGDLEPLAIRMRDLLARQGVVDATVRLILSPGAGTSPGRARLVLVSRGCDTTSVPRIEPLLDGGGDQTPALAAAFTRGIAGALSADALAAGIVAVRDALIARGFYAAEVGIDSISTAAPGAVTRVHVRVRAGAASTVESVELSGASATRPSAAGAIAGLRRGRAVTPAILEEARARLGESGLFAAVGDPRVAPGSVPGRARVVIPVEEASVSRFEGAVGVADEGGVTGLIDLALGNIAGTGRAAGFRWIGPGYGRADYTARYREPALFGRALDATLALDAQVADSLFTHMRWSLAVGGRVWAGGRASLALARSGSVYSGLARGASATWALAGRLTSSRLAPPLNPTGGIAATAGVEVGRRVETYPFAPRSSRGVFRGDAGAEWASGLGPRRALYASLRAEGVSLPGEGYPAEELRFVGGSEGLRGHRDRAFGGNRILAATLEHRWITDARGGRVYVFADAARHDLEAPLAAGTAALPPSVASGGSAASLARTVLSPGWEFGYGAGLRTRVASGLVGLDLGLAPGEPLRRATIHLRYASSW
jgi:outer membrane protein assembly factor BamA